MVESRKDRIDEVFMREFGRSAEFYFSAPGRTELGGNHTDHQRGCVLAAAVNLDALAAVSKNGDGVIRILSVGYAPVEISLTDLSPRKGEQNTTAALVRGVAAGFAQRGCILSGLDIAISSSVPAGAGLSSSAAFEALLGVIFNDLFFDSRLSAIEIAKIGQLAENVYFGKPCGLMDQAASAIGGVVAIDFNDPDAPSVERFELDLQAFGHVLFVVDSGAGHADLTHEYAAITNEMSAVCRYFGKSVLREVPENEFLSSLRELRTFAGDRAVLRAMHFYAENERVIMQTKAIKSGDFARFLELVRESGRSSWMLLQNVAASGEAECQALSFTLALCEKLLEGAGACRVHGGGFAGTAMAFVPIEAAESFKSKIEGVLGAGSCIELSIRRRGAVREI